MPKRLLPEWLASKQNGAPNRLPTKRPAGKISSAVAWRMGTDVATDYGAGLDTAVTLAGLYCENERKGKENNNF